MGSQNRALVRKPAFLDDFLREVGILGKAFLNLPGELVNFPAQRRTIQDLLVRNQADVGKSELQTFGEQLLGSGLEAFSIEGPLGLPARALQEGLEFAFSDVGQDLTQEQGVGLGPVSIQRRDQLGIPGAQDIPGLGALANQQQDQFLLGVDPFDPSTLVPGQVAGGTVSVPQFATGIPTERHFSAAEEALLASAPSTPVPLPGLPTQIAPHIIGDEVFEQFQAGIAGAGPVPPDQEELQRNRILGFLQGLAQGGAGQETIAGTLAGAGATGVARLQQANQFAAQQQRVFEQAQRQHQAIMAQTGLDVAFKKAEQKNILRDFTNLQADKEFEQANRIWGQESQLKEALRKHEREIFDIGTAFATGEATAENKQKLLQTEINARKAYQVAQQAGNESIATMRFINSLALAQKRGQQTFAQQLDTINKLPSEFQKEAMAQLMIQQGAVANEYNMAIKGISFALASDIPSLVAAGVFANENALNEQLREWRIQGTGAGFTGVALQEFVQDQLFKHINGNLMFDKPLINRLGQIGFGPALQFLSVWDVTGEKRK